MENCRDHINLNGTVNRQLFILSAGLLLQAHSAFASDPSNDVQAQAKAFFNPPAVAHSDEAVQTVGILSAR
jgi:hypothetical protein